MLKIIPNRTFLTLIFVRPNRSFYHSWKSKLFFRPLCWLMLAWPWPFPTNSMGVGIKCHVIHKKVVLPNIFFTLFIIVSANRNNRNKDIEKRNFHDLIYLLFWTKYHLNHLQLTYFSPMFHFYTPWKRQKTFGDVFLTFSGNWILG